jgi:2-keto-4-pentenoate hydratase/2-oxohepta-3-ene-1,7-dioic acid hydratase in catechol pathway
VLKEAKPMAGKIVAVHLNYKSRAAERGKYPTNPSYFLKSPSTLSKDGAEVVRPLGCKLLAFEGEIALIMKDTPVNVLPSEAWSYVREVTAANDFGVYDLRYADPGSNVHSKGWDGFTPIGPARLPGESVNPSALSVSTWVDSVLVQNAPAEDLLFSAEFVVSDLSRVLRLEDGDIILLGTPTGSSVIEPGQLVEVEVSAQDGLTTGRLGNRIVEGTVPIPSVGAPPLADTATVQAAYGTCIRTS